MANAKQLYQQGQEALAAGKRDAAYNLFIEAIEADDQFLDAWVALLPLADEDTQADILDQIEAIDPNHPALNDADDAPEPADFDPRDLFDADDDDADEEPARTGGALRGMFGSRGGDDDGDSGDDAEKPRRERPSISLSTEGEVVPGISRRDVFLYGGVLAAITVVMCGMTLLIINTRNASAASATQEAVALQATSEAIVQQQTATSIARATSEILTQTAAAFFPTATAEAATVAAVASLARPTFPDTPTPTWTPTASVSRIADLPTADSGITGRIIVWGGNNPASDGLYPIREYNPLDATFTRLGNDFVSDATVSRDGGFFVYRSTDALGGLALYSAEPDTLNNAVQLINFIRPAGIVNDRVPVTSDDGRLFVFVGDNPNVGEDVVWLYNNESNSIIQLTNDGATYRYAAISPDGSQVVAVRQSGNATDLVLISVNEAGFPQTLLTSDGNNFIEDKPAFAPDGVQIVYQAAANTSPGNNDIYLIARGNPDGANPIVTTDGDDVSPIFSPDGRFVAYASTQPTGAYNLFVLDLVTNTTYQITEEPRNPIYPAGWVTEPIAQ